MTEANKPEEEKEKNLAEQPQKEKSEDLISPQRGAPQQSEEARNKSESEKVEEKKEKPEKKKETPHVKKYEAIARGISLPISKKQAMYICNFIKGKEIDEAINCLSEVREMKRVVPFKGEIPHRKEKGVMSGRYPIKATSYFINLLKGLKGNALVNGFDLEKTRIYLASPSWAARPTRTGGRHAKRAYVILKAKEFPEKAQKKENKK